MSASRVLVIEKRQMLEMLHTQRALAERFLAHMLARNIRIEEDLIDQLFNSSEKRMARTLLLLARFGEPEASHRTLPKVSQEVLAEMVGTTRSRVNFFMNKFRKLGFIDYNGGFVLPVALPFGTACTVSPREAGVLLVASASVDAPPVAVALDDLADRAATRRDAC